MIKYKHDNLYRELISNEVRPEIRMLVAVADTWLSQRGHDLTITAVFGEVGVTRKSSTHKGRAVDIRTRDFKKGIAQELTDYINKTFSTGVTKNNGEAMVVAFYHNSGHGDHIHLQVATRPLIINTELGSVLL